MGIFVHLAEAGGVVVALSLGVPERFQERVARQDLWGAGRVYVCVYVCMMCVSMVYVFALLETSTAVPLVKCCLLRKARYSMMFLHATVLPEGW